MPEKPTISQDPKSPPHAEIGTPSPIEHLMFADDRPEYPMCFFLKARLLSAGGRIDRAAFSAAARGALGRHPLLAARLSGERWAKTSQISWTAPAAALPLCVDFGEGDEAFRHPVSGGHGDGWLDPTKDFPVRFFVREGIESGTAVDVYAQFHHSATDATGGARLIEDLLALYAGVEPRPVEPSLLATRADLREPKLGKRAAFFRDLQRIWLYFTHFPKPLPQRQGEMVPRHLGPGSYPARESVTVDAQTHDALRRAARRSGATVNDVLIRDTFLAVDRYAREQGRRCAIRVAMPVNMRFPEDAAMPAANVVSMCFLDRAPAALDEPRSLLAGIALETGIIKKHRLGTALLRVVRAAGRLPSGLSFLVRPPGPWSCASTVVLSNLGRPLEAMPLPRDAQGRYVARDLTLAALELYPPIRPQTRGAIGVVTYAGGLSVALNYDPRWISEAAARALMTQWTRALAETTADVLGTRRPIEGLVAEMRSRKTSAPFRSLPIGKNVGRPDPVR